MGRGRRDQEAINRRIAEISVMAPPAPSRDGWIECGDRLPPDGVVVMTRTAVGLTEQPLMRQGRLWFVPDGSMYVYYTPAAWLEIVEPPILGDYI